MRSQLRVAGPRIWNSIDFSIRQNLITNYIFKGPIIYSRGLLYILNGALSLVNSQIEIKIIIQKIKVKTSGLVNAKHLITYS